MALYQNQHDLDRTSMVQGNCMDLGYENSDGQEDSTQSSDYCEPPHGPNRFADGNGLIPMHGAMQQ